MSKVYKNTSFSSDDLFATISFGGGGGGGGGGAASRPMNFSGASSGTNSSQLSNAEKTGACVVGGAIAGAAATYGPHPAVRGADVVGGALVAELCR